MPAAAGSNSRPPTKEGWLHKMGGASHNKWQARWCSLQGRTLNYFTKQDDTHLQGSINLDEIMDVSRVGEHAGKPFCFSLVATKAGSKKVYYLAASDEATMKEWCAALKAPESSEPALKLVKYATAEVFLTQGVRIAGDVQYNILSSLSHRVPHEKKRRDAFGWYCDRIVALSTVLNLFAEYGWSPERIYRSSGVSAIDNSIQPVIRVILSKSPLGENKALITSSDKHDTMSRSGKHSNGPADSVSATPPQTPSSRMSFPPLGSGELLEGSDEELVELMKEFDIPLTLLQAAPSSS